MIRHEKKHLVLGKKGRNGRENDTAKARHIDIAKDI